MPERQSGLAAGCKPDGRPVSCAIGLTVARLAPNFSETQVPEKNGPAGKRGGPSSSPQQHATVRR
jgi:hypothetical protein